jgi:hypothetical protein
MPLLLMLLLLALQAVALGFGNNKEDSSSSTSIFVGGSGNWTYVFEPLTLPHDCAMEHAHGISIDESSDGDSIISIIVTYKDANDPSKCLLKWSSKNAYGEYNEPAEYLGPGEALCRGVPHGLATAREKTIRSSNEHDEEYVLYHANNEQALYKTRMDGSIIWSSLGPPPQTQTPTTLFSDDDDTLYRPTWIAVAPDHVSPYLYVADGYGSNSIYVYYKSNGTYTGHVFGGNGTAHGKFQTCHSIYWDERIHKMAVCDRENHRLEYFDIASSSSSDDDDHKNNDPQQRPMFQYSHSHTFEPFLQRLCNLRVRPSDGMGILASLEGMVGIVNAQNELISVLNVSDQLGQLGFLHPHDAHFIGDDGSFVLVTWNPGQVGYFRRVAVLVGGGGGVANNDGGDASIVTPTMR